MKKLLLTVIFSSIAALASFADDSVSCVFISPANGKNCKMQVKLNNLDSYIAFQMDIDLPDGFSIESVTPVKTRLAQGENVTIGGESVETPFVLDYNVIDATNNIVRVIAYNLGNYPITGDSGSPIFEMSLSSSNEINKEEVAVSCSNVVFVKSSDLTESNLNVTELIKISLGDANSDGVVNVGDLSSIVGYILNTNVVENFNKTAADANEDGAINVGDLSTIVKMILGQ